MMERGLSPAASNTSIPRALSQRLYHLFQQLFLGLGLWVGVWEFLVLFLKKVIVPLNPPPLMSSWLSFLSGSLRSGPCL